MTVERKVLELPGRETRVPLSPTGYSALPDQAF
jgi:hypothetical protein